MRPGSRAAALAAIERARDAGMLISVDPASAALLIDDPSFLRSRAARRPAAAQRDELAVLGGDCPT